MGRLSRSVYAGFSARVNTSTYENIAVGWHASSNGYRARQMTRTRFVGGRPETADSSETLLLHFNGSVLRLSYSWKTILSLCFIADSFAPSVLRSGHADIFMMCFSGLRDFFRNFSSLFHSHACIYLFRSWCCLLHGFGRVNSRGFLLKTTMET